MKILYDVILVSYGKSDVVSKCVSSIVDNSGEDTRLIWIENDPDNSCASEMLIEKFPVLLFPMLENIGWVKSVNMGLAVSTAPYVVIMNDDTEVCTQDWLPVMAECFDKTNAIGIVCPRHDQDWGIGRYTPNQGPMPVVPNWNLRGNGIGSAGIGFFCAMLSRDSITSVGYLDENFSPGYGDDDDWAMRAWLMGYKFTCQTNVLVKHKWHGSYTNATKRDELQTRAKNILMAKYGTVLASRLPQ
jgi:GT2 family glycosyltransferase